MAETSFVRWQGRALKQLTYAIDLIIALTGASLGFAMNLLRDRAVLGTQSAKWVLVGAVFLLLVSFVMGIFGVVTRLRNFRLTAQIASRRQSDTNKDTSDLGTLRIYSGQLGELTWTLFWLQLSFFGLGVVVLVVGVTVTLLLGRLS